MIKPAFRQPILAIVTLVFAFGATTAQAGLTTYSSYTSWSAATLGITSVPIPDPSPNSFIFFGTGTASVTYSNVVFSTSASLSNGNFFNVGSLFTGLPAVLSSQEQTTGVANILITLAAPVTSFSLDYGTFDGSSVTFTLSNGDSVTQGSTGSGYGVPDFFGATDTRSFTSVLVTTSDPTLDLNSVAVGSAIPEPSSLTLCGLAGLMGLGVAWRRRKRIAA